LSGNCTPLVTAILTAVGWLCATTLTTVALNIHDMKLKYLSFIDVISTAGRCNADRGTGTPSLLHNSIKLH
jgi:hypothetical protein